MNSRATIVSGCVALACWIASGPGVNAATNAAGTRPSAPPPPVPGIVIKPETVDTFRSLLRMTPEQRQSYLAERTPKQRAIIEKKLSEYEALQPEEREKRLRTMQHRLILRRMIRLPAPARTEHLTALPEADRKEVESRLQEWDRLPADLQSAVLENEWAIRLLARPEVELPALPSTAFASDPERERRLEQWTQLAPERREVIVKNFQHFFEELDEPARDRILQALPESGRPSASDLDPIQQLSKAERDLCLTNFQKYAALPPAEREQFLRNAELWDKMSPAQRALWRKIVTHIPDRRRPPVVVPPYIPRPQLRQPSPATN